MAKFYPALSRDFHGSEGERLVYQALSSLGNEYIVFHSYRWLGGYGQRRSEGEADFIVLHPKKGILVIEVKAGGISYHNGAWLQINRKNGKEKRIDPLGQAAESQYRLQYFIKTKFSAPYPLIGRAAWFPSVVLQQNTLLPAEANRAIVFDENSLDDVGTALDRAYSYWAKNVGHLSADCSGKRFTTLIGLLMPELRLIPTISSETRENEELIVRLTDRQASILHFLNEQPMAAIHGPAGTGKTLLAVEKAKMLAAEGKRVLYLCFNEFLLNFLRSQGYSGKITFHNVRTLAEELLGDRPLAIDQVIPVFEEYFAVEYADDNWPYPNIVVDEGQDISDAVLEHLAYLAGLYDGIFYAFYDRNQYIMRKETPEWLDKNADCRLVLYKNCRNTSEIATAISGLMNLKKGMYVNDIHGHCPRAVFCRDTSALCKAAEAFVREMTAQNIKMEDMVILTVRSTEHSALKGIDKLAGVPVSLEKAEGKVLFSSVRKFKGLEAKAVLLIDMAVSKIVNPLWQRLLYVGATRAVSYLQLAFLEDIAEDDYSLLLAKLTKTKLPDGRKGLLKLLALQAD